MSSEKILLINPIIRDSEPPYNVPTGLAIIANQLRRSGYATDVLDVNGLRLNLQQVQQLLSKRSYALVAAGGLITTYKYLKKLFPIIRSLQPQALLVVGGGVCCEPQAILGNLDVDLCVIGEGEHTMREIAEAVVNNRHWHNVRGIAWRDSGQVRYSQPRSAEKDLDKFPLPAYDLFPMEVYLKNVFESGAKTEVNIITSRGCPFNCKFCWHIFGRGIRFRSIDSCIEEILYLRSRYHIGSIVFVDENFTASPPRVLEFCQAMIEKGLDKIPWSCYGRVDTVDRQNLEVMRRAGCYRIGYGLESGSQKMLDVMNKRINVEKAVEAIRITREKGLLAAATLIFGMPGEDEDTARQTVTFCRENRIHVGLFYATPYPGTEIYKDPEIFSRIMRKYGSKDAFFSALGDAKDFVINMMDMSDECMLRLKSQTEAQILHRSPSSLLLSLSENLRARGIVRTARKCIHIAKRKKQFLKCLGDGEK